MPCSPIGAYDRRKNQFVKTKALADRATKIAEFAAGSGLDKLVAEVAAVGEIPAGSFDEVADMENIHMWLTEKMHLAEERYALAVTRLLAKDAKAWDEIVAIVKEEALAVQVDVPADVDAEDAFAYINKYVLDGMPCDEVRHVCESSPAKVVWEKLADTHAPYWEAVGGDVRNYYDLLDVYVKILLGRTKISFSRENMEKFILTYVNLASGKFE